MDQLSFIHRGQSFQCVLSVTGGKYAASELLVLNRAVAQMQEQSALLSARTHSDRFAGFAHVVSTASDNYQRMADILRNLEQNWAGVRYIRQAVSQKAEGINLADRSCWDDPQPPTSQANVPPNGWLSNDCELVDDDSAVASSLTVNDSQTQYLDSA